MIISGSTFKNNIATCDRKLTGAVGRNGDISICTIGDNNRTRVCTAVSAKSKIACAVGGDSRVRVRVSHTKSVRVYLNVTCSIRRKNNVAVGSCYNTLAVDI